MPIRLNFLFVQPFPQSKPSWTQNSEKWIPGESENLKAILAIWYCMCLYLRNPTHSYYFNNWMEFFLKKSLVFRYPSKFVLSLYTNLLKTSESKEIGKKKKKKNCMYTFEVNWLPFNPQQQQMMHRLLLIYYRNCFFFIFLVGKVGCE